MSFHWLSFCPTTHSKSYFAAAWHFVCVFYIECMKKTKLQTTLFDSLYVMLSYVMWSEVNWISYASSSYRLPHKNLDFNRTGFNFKYSLLHNNCNDHKQNREKFLDFRYYNLSSTLVTYISYALMMCLLSRTLEIIWSWDLLFYF